MWNISNHFHDNSISDFSIVMVSNLLLERTITKHHIQIESIGQGLWYSSSYCNMSRIETTNLYCACLYLFVALNKMNWTQNTNLVRINHNDETLYQPIRKYKYLTVRSTVETTNSQHWNEFLWIVNINYTRYMMTFSLRRSSVPTTARSNRGVDFWQVWIK